MTWHHEEPATVYNANRATHLGSHSFNTFRKSPAKFQEELTKQENGKEPDCFRFGRAYHSYILEGLDAFNAEFTVADGPINERTGNPYGTDTKAYAKWLEGMGDAVIVPSHELSMIEAMDKAVYQHARAAELLTEGMPERVGRIDLEGTPVQIRMDWVNDEQGYFVDLKGCQDLDSFERDIKKFGYDWQAAFYQDVAFRLSGKRYAPFLVAVEKKDKPRVGVWEMSQAHMDRLRMQMVGIIAELQCCEVTNDWPTRYEETRFYPRGE